VNKLTIRNGKTLSKQIDDNILITALLATSTVKEAAEVAGCTPRTVFNKLNDSEFSAALEAEKELRAERLRDSLDNAAVLAVNYLVELLTSNDFMASGSDKLEASRILLSSDKRFSRSKRK
jgi:hypothetical protein